MAVQSDITPRMRGILVNWLIEVCNMIFFPLVLLSCCFVLSHYLETKQAVVLRNQVHLKFQLMQETLFLMVQLLDRVLSVLPIKKDQLQMVGLTALLLASKYEDYWHPKVEQA